jgi:hypothetical protein
MANTNTTDNVAASRIILGTTDAVAHWSGSGAELASRYVRGTVELEPTSQAPTVGRIESCSFSEMATGEELPDGACGVEAYDFYKLGWKVQVSARFRAEDAMPRIGTVFALNMPEGTEMQAMNFVVEGEPKVDWALEGMRKISFSGKMHASLVKSSLTAARVRSDNSTAAQTAYAASGYADAIPTETTSASGTLTSNATNVSDGDTVTIGSTVYRFKNTMAQAYDVAIGTSYTNSLLNLNAAINATGVAGTNYYAGTLVHPTVSSVAFTAASLKVTALTGGTGGNAIATTETSSNLSWGAATLTGGLGTGSDPGV